MNHDFSVKTFTRFFHTSMCIFTVSEWNPMRQKGKEEVEVRAGEKWKIQYNKDWTVRFNFCCFDFIKKSKLVYRSLTSLPVCLLFSYSVERAPHVGKEREGGRAFDGAEGTTQRGGDLHRRLNSAPPNPHTHTRWFSQRTSACKRKHDYSWTHTCTHAHAVWRMNRLPSVSRQHFHNTSSFSYPEFSRAYTRLWLLPPEYVCAHIHTQTFYFLSSHNYLSQISLTF